jgi:hypothetical protein
MISVILAISPVSCVDFPIVLLLLRGPLTAGLNKSNLGHYLRLLHGYLIHSLDITDPVVKGVDDLNVLDVRDSITGIAEAFHVIPKALIRLLLYGL